MPRVSPYQGNFGSGEFSPLVYGRTDVERYKAGLARCKNEIPTLQGALIRRPGSKYVSNAKNNLYTRAIPFRFSNTQAYMLEFGNNYIRFYANRATVESSPGVPLELVSPYSTADLQDLKYVQSLDVLYLVHPDYPPRKLQRFSNTQWELNYVSTINGVNTFGIDGPYLKQNADSLVTLTPSAATGTAVTLAVTAAVINITAVSNGGGLVRLTVSAITNLSENTFVAIAGATPHIADGSYYLTNVTATTVDLKRTTFTTGGAVAGTLNFSAFSTVGVGSPVRTLEGTVWGWGIITAKANDYSVTVNVQKTLTSVAAKLIWRVGFYGTVNGYPNAVAFHEDRLIFFKDQRIDGSVSGDYENFAPSEGTTSDNTNITDDSAYSFTLNSEEANNITWGTSDEKGMVLGTEAGPWILRASVLGEALTATNVSAKKITGFGSSNFSAVKAGKSSIYIENSKRRIREVSYFYDVDGFRAIDLTELSEHLPASGINCELAFQSNPQTIVWMAKSDGTFLGITYDRVLDALRAGWHQHSLGGVSDTSGNPPIVESMAVIPSPDGTADDVWLIVKRYINGSTLRTVEYLTKIFESFNLQQDAYFLDCGATYDSPITVLNFTPGATTTVQKVAHGLATGDKVRFQYVVGVEDSDGANTVNDVLFTITVTDVDHFTLDDFDSSTYSAYVNSGTAVYRKMVTTISGLTWLKGETVGILGDGAVLPDAVVDSSGVLTLSYPSGVVQIGLRYSSEIKQLRIEGGSADGTSFGKNRRINEFAVMVDRSGSFEYGMEFNDSMFLADIRQPSDPIDHGPPLFSGIKENLTVEADYNTENQLCLRQSDPLPLTVLAIMPQMKTYDKA